KWPSSRGRVRPGSAGRSASGLPKKEPGLRPLTSTKTEPTRPRIGSPLEAAGRSAWASTCGTRRPSKRPSRKWRGPLAVSTSWSTAQASCTTSPPKGWDRVLDTNLKGAFLVSKHVLPHMRRRGRGAIVHIGSVTGIMGYTHLAAYCASKGGLHALTRAMAIEYAPLGIRVNAVAPGTVDTPILAGFLAETQDPHKARASFERIHPLGRIATPRDIANAALFLASDEAAFVTGHVLVADGGFTIHGVQPRE